MNYPDIPDPFARLKAMEEKSRLFATATKELHARERLSRGAAWATLIITTLVLTGLDRLTVKSLVGAGFLALLVRFLGWRWQESYAAKALKIIEEFPVPK